MLKLFSIRVPLPSLPSILLSIDFSLRHPLMEEEVEESEANWFDGAIVEELIRELLDDAPPFIISAKPLESKSSEDDDNDHPHKTIINRLISTVYSGPTISDIETALPMSFRSSSSSSNSSHASMILWPEKRMEKMENKYTVRVKRSSQSGLADDGYKWRKYGQKSIKNSTNPRSYYRCTNPRCSAKKQVERSMEDPDALIVTYEGVHLHYSSFSQFLPRRSHDHYSGTGPHAAKKPKLQFKNRQQACTSKEKLTSMKNVEQRQEGLLDDIVPFLVRKPCNSATLSNHPSQHSQASSPSNPSFLSWSPVSSYLDVDTLNSYHSLSE